MLADTKILSIVRNYSAKKCINMPAHANSISYFPPRLAMSRNSKFCNVLDIARHRRYYTCLFNFRSSHHAETMNTICKMIKIGSRMLALYTSKQSPPIMNQKSCRRSFRSQIAHEMMSNPTMPKIISMNQEDFLFATATAIITSALTSNGNQT